MKRPFLQQRTLSAISDNNHIETNSKAEYYEDHSQLMARATLITVCFIAVSLMGLLIYFCRMRSKTRVLSRAIS